MDFTKNLVLKENFTFLVADADGMVRGGERGLYNRDTRFLSRYAWTFDPAPQVLLAHSGRPDTFESHLAVMEGPSQTLAVHRGMELTATRLRDRLEVANTGLEPRAFRLSLAFAADFADLFEARGWYEAEHAVRLEAAPASVTAHYRASDGLESAVRVDFSPQPTTLTRPQPSATKPTSAASPSAASPGAEPPDAASPGADSTRAGSAASQATFELELAPGERTTIVVLVELSNPLEADLPAVPYPAWQAGFSGLAREPDRQRVLARATEDLRALLLFTEEGPLAAAGIPWFVTAFGRDSQITAFMLLPYHAEVARGTLRYLAARQGARHDAARSEAPGKILHEVRQGELARTGAIPFGRYFGSIDATPLFLMLLHRTYDVTGDLDLVRELRPNWEAALAWLGTDGDPDGDGFLEFAGSEPGKGLTVQSWKDSHDALSHADGSLATGAIAVAEVQGYAYAAYQAAAAFYRALEEPDASARYAGIADDLRQRFHEAFWVESLRTYALALDGDKRPLEVLASDAGQLLLSGIVPEDVAPRLVETLFSPSLFSGWGIRTLGAGEVRYNPVSYHTGSVWPHDTALIAGGLARYGFDRQAAVLRDALLDLAASQTDLRPPELIAGYPREDAPPVTYPVANRPQAWAAASLVYLAGLTLRGG